MMSIEDRSVTAAGGYRFTAVALALALFVMAGCGEADRDVTRVPAEPVTGGVPSQGHTAESEGYTLRANVLQSDSIPSAMRAQYGIEGGSDRGALNFVVLQREAGGQDITVAADVKARQENLHGQFEDIEMRAITSAGSISYLGTFASGSQENFRFMITAQPTGSDKTLVIEFEERLQAYD